MRFILSALAATLTLIVTLSPWSPPPRDERDRQPIQQTSEQSADLAGSTTIDGHAYAFIRVGAQTWLAENLLATRDRNGNSLASVSPEGADKEANLLGRLYPWDAARKSAPAGWRLPTVKDWQALIVFSGEGLKAGRKLLRTGPGEFGALLVGGIDVLGRNVGRGERAVFWTSAETSVDQAFCLTIARGGDIQLVPMLKTSRFSVRLIRDDSPEFGPAAPSPGSSKN